MIRFALACKWIGHALGCVAVVIIAMLAFPIFYDALARQAGHPTIWAFETSMYALIGGAFLANALALRSGHHFRVALLTSLFPGAKRYLDWLALITTVILGAIILISGSVLVHYSYQYDIHSASLLSVPLYIPQAVIPLGGLALMLEAISMLILGEAPVEDSEYDSPTGS